MSFWGEVQRRNVVKVGIAYLIGAWLLAQVVGFVLPTFNAPEWAVQTIVFFLILGFPIVLIVAWAFEITPEGVRLTSTVDRSESITSVTGQRLNYILTALLALAVVMLVVDNYLLEGDGGSRVEAGTTSTPADSVREAPAVSAVGRSAGALPNSVAVLPFANLSSSEDDAYFAAAIHEEILNQAAKLGNLKVIARTSVMQYANTTKTIPEIARELNVETVMEGSVRYAGSSILVTAQLIDPTTGAQLWSETYAGDRSDVNAQFAMQADIAMNVANALDAEFSPEEQRRIESVPTQSSEAHELYMRAQSLNVPETIPDAMRAIDGALAADPNFAEAWALKSVLHGTLTIMVPPERIAAERQASIEASARALAIDPSNVSARINQADDLAAQGDWIAAREILDSIDEASLLRAANLRLFIFYVNTGDYAAAFRAISALRDVDPLNVNVRGHFLEAHGLIGDMQGAADEYQRGVELFGEPWFGSFWWTLLLLDPSNRSANISVPPSDNALFAEASALVDRPAEGRELLHRRYEQAQPLVIGQQIRFAVWAAYFGDLDFSLDLMEEILERGDTWSYYFFFPMMKELRATPRFKAMLRDAGIVAYWKAYGWPDFCRPVGGDDFACD